MTCPRSSRPRGACSRVAAAALAAALSAACGWNAGLQAPASAGSVGVAFFDVDEDVLERGLSPELQAALAAAVTDLVGLRLVAPDDADLVISGRITDYGRRGGIRSKQHELLETAVRVTVEAELRRRSTGALLTRARGSVPSGYVTADRIDDPLSDDPAYVVGGRSEERRARERALRIVAEGLVLDLFAPPAPDEPGEAR